jgi:hypothetical protein
MNKKVVQEKVNYCKFIYKAKLVLKTSNKEIMSDPEAINLIYIQATQDVVSERYPAKVDDITVLAALQLQATFGDFKKDIHFPGWLKPKLEQFMPRSLFCKNNKPNEKMLKDWEQMILNKYAKVAGFTSLEAKLNYLVHGFASRAREGKKKKRKEKKRRFLCEGGEGGAMLQLLSF